MSLNCKTSGLNGGLLTSSKMRKTVKVPNSGWKRKRFVLFLWVFLVVIGFCLFLFSGVFRKKMEGTTTCEDKSLVLVEQFNVSKQHLHDLASSFYDSDQITTLKCAKQTGDEMSTKCEITCALKVADHGQNVELWGQCPVPGENSASICQKTLQTTILEKLARGHCMCALFIIALCSSIPCLWKIRKGEMEKTKEQTQSSSGGAGKWMKKLLVLFVLLGAVVSIWLYWYLNDGIQIRRKETLENMCDERARMLQDQFNVSMNHVHALAILVSTFYHGKEPPAIDQKTFGEYTERTSFERPLTSGVAYALRVRHFEREKFEKEHGWTIKKMETEDQDQTLAQDCDPENLDPSPIQDEYAPVILSQETVSHIVSIDMMSGKVSILINLKALLK